MLHESSPPNAEVAPAASARKGKQEGAAVATMKRGTVDDPRASAVRPSSSSSRGRRAQNRLPFYEDVTSQSDGSASGDGGGGGGGSGDYSSQGYSGASSGGGNGRGGGHPYHRNGSEALIDESHRFSASGSSSWEQGVGSRGSVAR